MSGLVSRALHMDKVDILSRTDESFTLQKGRSEELCFGGKNV